jgi:hypothetical protein
MKKLFISLLILGTLTGFEPPVNAQTFKGISPQFKLCSVDTQTKLINQIEQIVSLRANCPSTLKFRDIKFTDNEFTPSSNTFTISVWIDALNNYGAPNTELCHATVDINTLKITDLDVGFAVLIRAGMDNYYQAMPINPNGIIKRG